MSLIFDIPLILLKDLLCTWITQNNLIIFDTSFCNQRNRKILKTFYSTKWFILDANQSVDNIKCVTTSECMYNLRKLDWFSFRNIKLKSFQILVAGDFMFHFYLTNFLKVCSIHIQHIFIHCEVGFNLWRDVHYDQEDERHELTCTFRKNKNYVPPDIIPDAHIDEDDLCKLLSHCPNVKGLTVHNVGSLNRKMWNTYLKSLTFFSWSKSFQPYMSCDDLKKHLDYVDPTEIYWEERYQDYLSSCSPEENIFEMSLEHYYCCQCGNIFSENCEYVEHQLVCQIYLEHFHRNEKKKNGSICWYKEKYYEDFDKIISDVCPHLVEVEPQVFRLV
jgi:hypothetical protein